MQVHVLHHRWSLKISPMNTQLFKHLRLEILTRQCDTSICFKMSSMKRRMMLLEFETCNFHLPSLLYLSTFQSHGKHLWGRYWEKKMWTKISGLSITDVKAHQAVHVENKTACVLCSKTFNFISSLKIHKQYFISLSAVQAIPFGPSMFSSMLPIHI